MYRQQASQMEQPKLLCNYTHICKTRSQKNSRVSKYSTEKCSRYETIHYSNYTYKIINQQKTKIHMRTYLTMTGFSLPATNPKPNSGCRVSSTCLGCGGSSVQSLRGSSYVVVLLRWLWQRHSILFLTESICCCYPHSNHITFNPFCLLHASMSED